MKLGKVIFTLREKKGLKQAQLAEKAGLSRTALSLIETGKSMPSDETLKRIAKALNTHPVFFSLMTFNPESDMTPEKNKEFNLLFPNFHEKIMSFLE